MIAARQERNSEYRPPALLNALTWTFLDGPVKPGIEQGGLAGSESSLLMGMWMGLGPLQLCRPVSEPP